MSAPSDTPAQSAVKTEGMTLNGIEAAFNEWCKTLKVVDRYSNLDIFGQGYVAGWNANEAQIPAGPWCIPAGEGNECVICEGDDPNKPGKIVFVLRAPNGLNDRYRTSHEFLAEQAALVVRAVNECGAESNRHSGAVGAEKRAEQSNPGGGHVTEPTSHENTERRPATDEPTPGSATPVAWMAEYDGYFSATTSRSTMAQWKDTLGRKITPLYAQPPALTEGMRKTAPWVCCHCDADLSCAACGHEQPNDSAYYAAIEAEAKQCREARDYVLGAIASYDRDQPDNDFQRGHLAALEVVRDEAFTPSSVASTAFCSPSSDQGDAA